MTNTAMERALRLLRACTHCGEFFMPDTIEEHQKICFARLTWGEMRRALDAGDETLVTTNAYMEIGRRVGLIVPAQRLLEQMGLVQWQQLGTFYRLKVTERKALPADAPAFMVPIGTTETVPIEEVVRAGLAPKSPTKPVVSALATTQPIVLGDGQVECPHCHTKMQVSGYTHHKKTCFARFSDDEIRKILDDGQGHIMGVALYESSPEWRQGLPTATTFVKQLGVKGWAGVAERFGLLPNSTNPDRNKVKALPVPEPEREEPATEEVAAGETFVSPVIRVKRRGEIYCEFCKHPYAIKSITKHQNNCYARFTLPKVREALDDGTGTIVTRNDWDAKGGKRGNMPTSETLMKQLGLHYWNEIAHYFNLERNLLPGRPRHTKLYVNKRKQEKHDEVVRAKQAKEVATVTVDEQNLVVNVSRRGITGDRRAQLAALSRPTVREALDASRVILEKPLENGLTLVRKMNEGGGYTETLLKDGVLVKESTLGNPI